jgi:hypothetical protein
MTSTQQKMLGSKIGRRKMDLHFEVVWSKEGNENLMAEAARRKQEPSRLGGLTFPTVLVDSQTSDFRFKRLSRHSEFRGRA